MIMQDFKSSRRSPPPTKGSSRPAGRRCGSEAASRRSRFPPAVRSLLYNGILKDQSAAGGNVLTGSVFEALPKFDGPKVIYAAANRLGARAQRENITFKQTTYALEI